MMSPVYYYNEGKKRTVQILMTENCRKIENGRFFFIIS